MAGLPRWASLGQASNKTPEVRAIRFSVISHFPSSTAVAVVEMAGMRVDTHPAGPRR